jgi:hypothetical protein
LDRVVREQGDDGLDVALRVEVSWPGFRGDLIRRTICPPERRTSRDATTQEVPPGAD